MGVTWSLLADFFTVCCSIYKPCEIESTRGKLRTYGGEKKKYLTPTSRKDPKFEELQKVLMEWINATLLPEHIVVRSLEEDMFDGLILHHLFQKLAALKVDVEDIALTAASQRRKLEVVLESVNRSLQLEEPQAKWSVDAIFKKDLLATVHLLVALAKRFQPELALPNNVQVEVITIESTRSGLKSEKLVEQLTECGADKDQPSKDVFDELFKLAPEKVNAVKEAIMNFVNQKLDRLGLSVQNLDTQFADGVILLLLIGQLQGFFLHLKEFYLTPSSPAEMAQKTNLLREPHTGPLSWELVPPLFPHEKTVQRGAVIWPRAPSQFGWGQMATQPCLSPKPGLLPISTSPASSQRDPGPGVPEG
ncbi:gamma-parvin isoform X2 [Nycticebus coucang]|uniref:gamma-parvin isoform X2 n=1 Tax=Nycticebus coucang TaxID=9470 RepID=UPI00234C93C5|nr:gamma-parvin isoform X2 [Nycticebus coucang]